MRRRGTRLLISELALAVLLATAARGAAAADDAPPAGSQAPGPSDAAAAAPLEEEIVVTATRGARAARDATSPVTVLSRADVERSPAKTVDELLRVLPSFGLFRRSSSLAADPSSQGVNLRGIGPSGVSRSLVLVDGVPANDPFGGWIYWRAIPRAGVERVEVVPGGGSALYGNYALGGVTQILSRRITPLSGFASAEYGSLDTWQLGLSTADRRGPIGFAIDADGLSSGGHAVVAPEQRGAIDGETPSWHTTVNARVQADARPDLTLTLRGGYFFEDFDGGTQFTTAEVRRFAYAASGRYTPEGLGALDLTVFGHDGEFRQDRTRVTTDPRAAEAQAAHQEVPADDVGVSVQWTSPAVAAAGTHTVTLGSDVRRITGESREDLFPAASAPPTAFVRRDAGGAQRLYGVFVQDQYALSPALALDVAVRYDRWDNVDASKFERRANGQEISTPFADRSDDALSPKVGVRLRLSDAVTLRGSAYRAFRAPTLNELYRSFQVGQVVTAANENLGAEVLSGGEAGVEVSPARGLTARVTGFWNVMEDPITNVTTGTNLRQRQNLGRARIRGVETSAAWRLAAAWTVNAAYTFVEPVVTDAPGQPELVGKDLLQDPRHRASAALSFADPRLLAATVQLRYVGAQYEDDLNTLPMGEYVLVDVSASRRVAPRLDAFLAVENLLDREYLVGRAGGLGTVGQPRFVHGGMRMRFGG